MRTLDESKLVFTTSELIEGQRPPVLELIAAFCKANMPSIREELVSLTGSSIEKWVLDLSSTALHSLLCEWADSADELRVTCDDSKPIAANKAIHDAMIGNTDRVYHTLFGARRRLTYNLGSGIHLARSIDEPGLQIADVVASTTAAVFERPKDPELGGVRDAAIAGCSDNVIVLPVLAEIDLESAAVRRNSIVLQELVRRSLAREEMLPGAAEFALRVTDAMRLPLPEKFFETEK